MDTLEGIGGGAGRTRRPQRILLVEPDHQRRVHAAQVATHLGIRVMLAADASEASSVLARQAARLDAVIVSLSPDARAQVEQAIAAARPDLQLIDWGTEPYSAARFGALLGQLI